VNPPRRRKLLLFVSFFRVLEIYASLESHGHWNRCGVCGHCLLCLHIARWCESPPPNLGLLGNRLQLVIITICNTSGRIRLLLLRALASRSNRQSIHLGTLLLWQPVNVLWSAANKNPSIAQQQQQQRTIIMTTGGDGSSSSSSSISMELLTKQNAETSSAVIDLLASDKAFVQLSMYEGHLTVTRDKQDDEKLQVGIDYAKAKGVIDPDFVPEPYVQIDVLGKTPGQVADEILQSVERTKALSSSSSSSSSGLVIVLVGLSGTGKGTTVTQLVHKLQLQATGSGVVTWSNGNIFRSVTLLAATWCEQQQQQQNGADQKGGGDQNNNGAGALTLDKEAALTKENLASFMGMLSFGKNPNTNEYDTHIQGLGLDLWVSAVQNTDLKSPKVSKNIPTVAEVTQVRRSARISPG
jgi:cytidylate kinase